MGVPSATTFLLILVSLLFLSPSPATGESEYVLDVSGKPLEVGSEYYIQALSAPFRLLGRTSGRQTPYPQCPNYVGVGIFPQGGESQPARFAPIGSNVTTGGGHDLIPESSDVTISFPPLLTCRIGGMWELRFDPLFRSSLVTADSFDYNNGNQAFRIIPVEGSDVYMIGSCPASPPGLACSPANLLSLVADLSVSSWILGRSYSNSPVVVVFIRADDQAQARSTSVGVATN